MPTPMLADLKQEAADKGMTVSELLRQYLRYGGLGQHQDGVDLKRKEGSVGD